MFHVIGLRCQECGSYNTCRAAEPDPHPTDDSSCPTPGGATNHTTTTTESGDAGAEGGVTSGNRVVTHPSDDMVNLALIYYHICPKNVCACS